jgi:hypothetical protein
MRKTRFDSPANQDKEGRIPKALARSADTLSTEIPDWNNRGLSHFLICKNDKNH